MGKITFDPQKSEIIKYRKEKGFFEQYSLISFDDTGGFNEVITLRLYSGGASIYAAIWAHKIGQKNTDGTGGG